MIQDNLVNEEFVRQGLRNLDLMQEQVGRATASKLDSDKLPMQLLDPQALEGLAKVLQFGASKYAPNNWRQGFKYTRLIGALLRHTFALLRGELNDPESGLPHIDHIGCCWMFLSNMSKTRPDLNDLPKTTNPTTEKDFSQPGTHKSFNPTSPD